MTKQFLDKFNDLGGIYVSWKNNHELEDALQGKTDIDIFIPKKHKEKFIQFYAVEGWLKLINPIADYPEIIHLYGLNKSMQVFHIHVYFEIITGESWLKEYMLPLGDFLIENRIRDCKSEIFILNEKAQSFIFALRHYIKGYSLFSRLLYKKELNSYCKEWEIISSFYESGCYEKLIDLTPFNKKSGLLENKLTLPNKHTAAVVRNHLSPYLRYKQSSLFFRRFDSLCKRFFNKAFLKRKKVFPKNGYILVLSGPDGVGKSTMVNEILSIYNQFITVKITKLGKPQGGVLELIRKVIKRKKSIKKVENGKCIKISSKKDTSLLDAVLAIALGWMRLRAAKNAAKNAKKGFLVISDRWPTLQFGFMDGPKIVRTKNNLILRLCERIENFFYTQIPNADLCIVLTIPTDIAIERNRNRVKEGKETDEEILDRHSKNINHKPISKSIIYFDNNGSLEKKRIELIKLIQEQLIIYERDNKLQKGST